MCWMRCWEALAGDAVQKPHHPHGTSRNSSGASAQIGRDQDSPKPQIFCRRNKYWGAENDLLPLPSAGSWSMAPVTDWAWK